MSSKKLGSGIDDFLREEGIFDEAQAQAVKEVVAWQLAQAMKKRGFPKRAWPEPSRPAALRWTACWIRRTTSRSPACNGRRRWSDAG